MGNCFTKKCHDCENNRYYKEIHSDIIPAIERIYHCKKCNITYGRNYYHCCKCKKTFMQLPYF